jgi:uncharacterized membrane protein YesL
MLTGSFSAKAYSFFDTLLWIACLNLLWIVFSIAGLGVFGVGPATAAALYASQALPGLIPFFSIGAWLYVTGWLCDRFFAANDESVTAAAEAIGAAEVSDARHHHPAATIGAPVA